MDFKQELKEKTASIEDILRKYLPNQKGFQQTCFDAVNYSVLNGGKRLRPILMNETYRLFGGKGDVIEPFMAAIEFMHSSSLVHDDLPAMDADEYRRGRKTTWVVYKEDMAILAGDALMIMTFETASKAFGLTDRADLVGRAVSVLGNKSGIYGMVGGQSVDVELTDKPIPKDTLNFIYKLKTSALLEASMMIGAILAGASDEEISTVEQIAGDVGLAFQIQDDILDVTSSSDVLGKPVLSDDKNNKTTYVTIEGIDKAHEKVVFYSDRAIESLDKLPYKNEFLRELILTLINRKK